MKETQSIVLISRNIMNGPMPKLTEETEQKLNLSVSGKGSLTRYEFSGASIERRNIEISEIKAKAIMELLPKENQITTFDVGSWSLTYYFSDGTDITFEGTLSLNDGGRSEEIRKLLGIRTAFLFEGR